MQAHDNTEASKGQIRAFFGAAQYEWYTEILLPLTMRIRRDFKSHMITWKGKPKSPQ